MEMITKAELDKKVERMDIDYFSFELNNLCEKFAKMSLKEKYQEDDKNKPFSQILFTPKKTDNI